MRKTKIIATIGPVSRDPETLEKLILAGMDCARLNFSHGTFPEHEEVIRDVRRLSEKHGRQVAILQDLGGVKLRLGNMDHVLNLNHGDEYLLTADEASDDPSIIPFPEPGVLRNLRENNLVFISDGIVCLEVLETNGLQVRTRVRNGGTISSYKGVNLPGVSIDMPVLTDDDKAALRFGVEQKVDWVAVSFVRTGHDVREAKAFLQSIGSQAPVMAKLERSEGIDNLDEILQEVDGVMVARGDLGVEIPMERVPLVQKEIVRKANEAAKSSCIATQMLRSMVVSPTPTRAEVSDICNAVLDGCDLILLSDEIAVGAYPVEAVQVADTAIREAEKIYPYYKDFRSRDRTQAIAAGASSLARELHSKPIVVTSTGRAAYEVSRYRPEGDIIVFAHDEETLRRLCLGWGLQPSGVIPPEQDISRLVAMLIGRAMSTGLVNESDVVTIVHGSLTGVSGTTNTIQVLDVQEYLSRYSDLVEAAAGA
ncbi:Pyruvate kinase [Geodia barretti]|uniref:Pyruvate kinase n=3 Tax=Geodia barretti TaxID=519541 RepID=A0AA35SBE6_GEOBA|nr:Pyruvate kinase [Geodia barretti]